MDNLSLVSLPPRKSAIQARSRATVDAIFEATIQVLVVEGPTRLTTTRVAQRAGVSVGSLYQYYPNKRSLLFAVLNRNLDRFAVTVETACQRMRTQPIAMMVGGLVAAYVALKTERVDASLALYAVAHTMDTAGLVMGVTLRAEAAVAAMFATAPDAQIDDPDALAFMVMAAMTGVVRAAFERGKVGDTWETIEREITAMCLSYVAACCSRGAKTASLAS